RALPLVCRCTISYKKNPRPIERNASVPVFAFPFLNYIQSLLYSRTHRRVSACLQIWRVKVGCRMKLTFNLYRAEGNTSDLHSCHGYRACGEFLFEGYNPLVQPGNGPPRHGTRYIE